MKRLKIILSILFLSITFLSIAQKEKTNSDTRQFINNADFIQVNRDWNIIAEFKSGIGETVDFFPVEAIDLKTNKIVKSLQMDMIVSSQNASGNYFKSSWIDMGEIEEFIFFLEQYVIPNLKDKAESKQSTTYIFNSKEITFSFRIGKFKRISIYLKDNGITDTEHYFWTESQVSKIPDLLELLKKLK